jgi:hypothetical protein
VISTEASYRNRSSAPSPRPTNEHSHDAMTVQYRISDLDSGTPAAAGSLTPKKPYLVTGSRHIPAVQATAHSAMQCSRCHSPKSAAIRCKMGVAAGSNLPIPSFPLHVRNKCAYSRWRGLARSPLRKRGPETGHDGPSRPMRKTGARQTARDAGTNGK